MQPVDTVSLDPHLEPLFQIGQAIVEPPLHQICLHGTIHKVEPRVMRVLLCLARRPGQPVTRDELLDAVWAEGLPNDEGLTQAVCKLRKAFGDRATHATVIETIPKVGYRLIAPVSAQPKTSNGHDPVFSNRQAPVSSNGQEDQQKEPRGDRQAPLRPPLRPTMFGFGYGLTEWRWLGVCFGLLILFCALWMSYGTRPPVPAEQHRVLIHRMEPGFDSTTPHRQVRIVMRKYEAPFVEDETPLKGNQQAP